MIVHPGLILMHLFTNLSVKLYMSVPQNTEVQVSVTTPHQARVTGLWMIRPEEKS